VLAGSGTARQLLGSLVAVVDTNRTPLQAAGTSFLLAENLGEKIKGLIVDSFGSRYIAAMPDDSGVVLAAQDSPGCRALFFQPIGGEDPVRLTPQSWCESFAFLALSPDGRRVALSDFFGNLRFYDIATQTTTSLAPDGVNAVFSSDGAKVLFTSDAGLDIINVDGSGRRTLVHATFPNDLGEYAFSPDGLTVSYVLEGVGTLFVIGVDGKGIRPLLPNGSIGDPGLCNGKPCVIVDEGANRRHVW